MHLPVVKVHSGFWQYTIAARVAVPGLVVGFAPVLLPLRFLPSVVGRTPSLPISSARASPPASRGNGAVGGLARTRPVAHVRAAAVHPDGGTLASKGLDGVRIGGARRRGTSRATSSTPHAGCWCWRGYSRARKTASPRVRWRINLAWYRVQCNALLRGDPPDESRKSGRAVVLGPQATCGATQTSPVRWAPAARMSTTAPRTARLACHCSGTCFISMEG